MADDLAELRAAVRPRPNVLVRRLVGRVEPPLGFLAYGGLWVVVSGIATLLGSILAGLVGGLFHVSKHSAAQHHVVLAVGIACGLASWWPFVQWVRRKRGRARALIRDGVFVDGIISQTTGDRALNAVARAALDAGAGTPTWGRVLFTHGGARFGVRCPFRISVMDGTPCPLLYLPGYGYAFFFHDNGRADAAKVFPA